MTGIDIAGPRGGRGCRAPVPRGRGAWSLRFRGLPVALLSCGAALLGGCAVGLPPDPVASSRSVYAGGAPLLQPRQPSALQGVPFYGAPAPYAGGVVSAPLGILPRAISPGQPGLAIGVDAPPVVAPGSSMAGPRFGDIVGAGPVIDVRERRYSNGATQDIVYRAPATASGENKLAVSVVETAYRGGDGESLKLSAPSPSDIESEIRTAFPVGSMTIADDMVENASGVFGYARGRIGGETCLYAWQFIAPPVRRSLLDDLAGLEGYDASVRMRFCGRKSVSELVALMKGVQLHLERLRGAQGLLTPAPTLTPAVLATPGAVVAEPLGAGFPASPATGTPGVGAQPAAMMRVSGVDGPAYAVPGVYVPVMLPGETAPVLMLRPALSVPAAGRETRASDPRPRHAARPARRAIRPRGHGGGDVMRDTDARPPTGAVAVYRGQQVRTVRSPADRAGGRDAAAAGRPFIPLPAGTAPAPAAPPAPPAPPSSASLDGLPMPR